MTDHPIVRWHHIVEQRNPAALSTWLADDAVFFSPVVHTPQVGKAITQAYLTAAMQVLAGQGNASFRYVREVVGPNDAVLEFETTLNGVLVNGVDIIRWNAAGQVTEFKVMLRPLKAVNLVHELMGQMLLAAQRKG
jgi:hypothetical protein